MSIETRLHAFQRTQRENYLDFDGTDDYITVPHDSVQNITGDLTLECWVYIDVGSTFNVFVSKALNNGASENAYDFRTDNSANPFLSFVFLSTGVGVQSAFSTSQLDLNKWYHVAVTRDVSTSQIKFYINGYLDSTTGYSGTTATGTTRPLLVGKRDDNFGFLDGKISEVRIWDDVRTQQEIGFLKNQTLLNSEKNGLRSDLDLTNLVAYYPLNEGTGTTANNYVTNGNNGTLTNFSGTYWLTATPPLVYDRTYKAHTSRFLFSEIQANTNAGIGALNFTLPNISDASGNEIFRDLKGVELRLDIARDIGTTTIFNGINRTIDYRPRNVKSIDTTAYTLVEALSKGYTPKQSDGTYNFTYSSTEIADIFKDLIYSYNNQNPIIPLNFTSTSIETTGKTVTHTFYNPKNFLTAFDSIWQYTDEDWIWFIDVDNTLYLKQISTTPDFIFTYGKDFMKASVKEDSTDIVNRIRITNGSVHRAYTNDTSRNLYGQRIEILKDERLNTAGMDERADRILNSSNTPNYQLEAIILDQSVGGRYDIFSNSLLGKVFTVVNTDETISNQVISSVSYNPIQGTAKIVSSDRIQFISRELVNLKNSIFQTNFGSSSPDTYTEV